MTKPVPEVLGALVAEHAALEQRLADPAVHGDRVLARQLSPPWRSGCRSWRRG